MRAKFPISRQILKVFAALCLFGTLVAMSPLPTNTYHVALTGRDTNPGSEMSPFRTIQRAVNIALPGDLILVHAGTYPEALTIRRSGTLTGRIRLRAAGDGPTTIAPTLRPLACTSMSPSRDMAVQFLGADYWTIRGFNIQGGVLVSGLNLQGLTDAAVQDRTLPGRGSYDPDAAATTSSLLGVEPADHVWIRFNKITARGINVTGARWTLVEGNEIAYIECGAGAAVWFNRFADLGAVQRNFVHHTANGAGHWMSEGLRFGSASSYNLVEDNRVEDMGGMGGGINTDVAASWNVIRRNVVRRARDGFNEQMAGWGNQWYQNRAEDTRRYGFVVAGFLNLETTVTHRTPVDVRMWCNVTTGNRDDDMYIGSAAASSFDRNGVDTVGTSSRLRAYWTAAGDTWNGSSQPPQFSQTPNLSGCSAAGPAAR